MKRSTSSPRRRVLSLATAAGALAATATLVCMSYVVMPSGSPSGTVSAASARAGGGR